MGKKDKRTAEVQTRVMLVVSMGVSAVIVYSLYVTCLEVIRSKTDSVMPNVFSRKIDANELLAKEVFHGAWLPYQLFLFY